MNDYANDVPLELAQRAHSGTSFVPERRAEQERADYAQTLTADRDGLTQLISTPEKAALLEAEFARYRAGYRRRFLAVLAARSACISMMIAGPSNFPTERQRKRGATVDRRYEELAAWRERALKAIRRTLCPELAPIMTSDADAVERLGDKVAKAEAKQARMRAANLAIRKHRKAGAEAQVAALVALGFSPFISERLLEPDFAGRVGFPDYELTNNAANIRRMRQRAETVAEVQAQPERTVEGSRARIEDCPADNRVRLFFPGKPDLDVRTRLKRGGFRWAPSLGCWQACRNHGALALAAEVAG